MFEFTFSSFGAAVNGRISAKTRAYKRDELSGFSSSCPFYSINRKHKPKLSGWINEHNFERVVWASEWALAFDVSTSKNRERNKSILEMAASRASLNEISLKFNISRNTVCIILSQIFDSCIKSQRHLAIKLL